MYYPSQMTETQANGVSASQANQNPDPYLEKITLIDQLPSDAWAEGVAIRPDGNVLTSRLDEPELFAIDLASTQLSGENDFDVVRPKIIHTFENATGVFNLCPLKGTKREEYAVISGWADLANATFHSFVLWRVVPSANGDDLPEVTKIGDIPEGQFCMGMEPLSETVLLIADCHRSCIYRVDIPTGTVSKFLEHPSMRPLEGEFFGVNRLKVLAGYIWFTNTSTGTLSRAPIEHINHGQDIRVTGPIQHVADGLANAEGLVMFDNAEVAYVNSYASGNLWRIDIDVEAGKGLVTCLREDLVSPTAMQLVSKDKDAKPTLYILCCGSVDEEWLSTERGTWFDLANVKDKVHITVTVTTEIT